MNGQSRKIHIFRFMRFMVAGGINTLVDFLVLNCLVYFFSVSASSYRYLLFKTISFSAAVINSYLLNKYWVFRHTQKSSWRERGSFLIVSMVGLVINAGVSSIVFHSLVSMNEPNFIIVNASAITGTLFVLGWNFFGYKRFVFKKI